MGETTAIAWTNHTFNPWMGCSHVSPGCDHCYAEALGKRTGRVEWGDDAARVMTSPGYWRNPAKWDRAAREAGRPALVFCASLADVFEDRPELVEPRARLFELMVSTPWLVWQLLTKRPENVLELVPNSWLPPRMQSPNTFREWPSNVWIGTTVEDQQRAEERIPRLLEIPAPVRFLSCEPLLGEVRLARWLWTVEPPAAPEPTRGIGWVIVGGESGPRHRPMDLRHARILKREAEGAGVPFFYKQTGGATPKAGGDTLDGEVLKAFPPGPWRPTPLEALGYDVAELDREQTRRLFGDDVDVEIR